MHRIAKALAHCIAASAALLSLASTPAGADGTTAITALDKALGAAWRATIKLKVDAGTCSSMQVAGWKHYLSDDDEMVLGIRTDCQFPDRGLERTESPVRFNMLHVRVEMDDESVIVTCRDGTECITVEPGGSYPMAGQRVFVWSFKPLLPNYGPELVSVFAAGQAEHAKLVADNIRINDQIAAERQKTGIATATTQARQ